MEKYKLYAIFSIVLPLTAYIIVYSGFAPDRLLASSTFMLLAASFGVGLILSVLGLINSSKDPVNMSREVLFGLFLSLLGMLANIIALEVILTLRFSAQPY